jgi:nucleoside-diphosphate-sugar epimerase
MGAGTQLNISPGQSTVLLTGASSQLGVFLIPRLLAEGFRVLALSRKAIGWVVVPDENLLWLHPDTFTDDAAGTAAAGEADSLISCGPMVLAVDAVRKCPMLERAVVFSTSSIFSKAGSQNRGENNQTENIIAHESELKALCEERGLALLCLHPTLIYGCGLDRNISVLASWIRRFGFLPLAGAASGLRQPVHADDLAQAAVQALVRDDPLVLDSPACGGSTLSYRQMAELIFDGLDRPRRIIRIPTGIMATLVGLLAILPAFRGINRQMVRRQNSDLVFDDTLLRQALDYNPRPFKPTPEDFQIPPSAKKYRSPE